MKSITLIGILKNNKQPIHEYGTIKGDINLLNEMFFKHKKSLEKNKRSYIFKIEQDLMVSYEFSLTKQEYEEAIKYIPLLNEKHLEL